MSGSDLSAMLERCEKATEGPWKEISCSVVEFGNAGLFEWQGWRLDDDLAQIRLDADFIAHARTDLPLVVKELQEARRLLELCLAYEEELSYGLRNDIREFLGVSDAES